MCKEGYLQINDSRRNEDTLMVQHLKLHQGVENQDFLTMNSIIPNLGENSFTHY